MLSHLFTTPIAHERLDASSLPFDGLREYLRELRLAGSGELRSNRGGWHSEGNLFDPADHRQFPAFAEALTGMVLAYLRDAMAFEGRVTFSISGWAVVNCAGDTNAPHNHARSLLSGVCYLQVPEAMRGGEIVFMDPRFNANAYGTEEMRRIKLRPPWDLTTVVHMPVMGDLLLFPSWLMHYVQSFEAPDPDALRIVVSFNVAV